MKPALIILLAAILTLCGVLIVKDHQDYNEALGIRADMEAENEIRN